MAFTFYALVFSAFTLSIFVWMKMRDNSDVGLSSSAVGARLSAGDDGEYDRGENLQRKDGVGEAHKSTQKVDRNANEMELKGQPEQPLADDGGGYANDVDPLAESDTDLAVDTQAVPEGSSEESPSTVDRENHIEGNQDDKEDEKPQARFYKMDSRGGMLKEESDTWSCVYDEQTGLVWEAKTTNGLHSATDRYSWFNPRVMEEQGMHPGSPDSSELCFYYNEDDKNGLYDTGDCNTEAFEQRVNDEALCGVPGWRLPSVEELSTLVVRRGQEHVVDRRFFPNIQTDSYWSNASMAYDEYNTWAYWLTWGTSVNDAEKKDAYFVMLVTEAMR